MLIRNAIVFAILSCAAAAQSATLLSVPGPTAAIGSPGSISYNFVAGAGAANTSFVINGFNTLDGLGFFTDTFTLSLNGTALLSGTYNLGGGGVDTTYFAPGGATIVTVFNGLNLGGTATITTALTLLSGNNTLSFDYSGNDQGINDESWALSDLVVTGSAVVPEPASWAMLITGLGLVGTMQRRRATRAIAA